MRSEKPPLHELLDIVPYSCVLQPGSYGYTGKTGLAYYSFRLRSRPTDIVEYVTSRLHLEPSDWWWMLRRAGDEEWIEINVGEAAVLHRHSETMHDDSSHRCQLNMIGRHHTLEGDLLDHRLRHELTIAHGSAEETQSRSAGELHQAAQINTF